jgi:hypothetical protein
VRDGIYAVNEARGLLGLDPVPGGDQPMIYGAQGAVPLAAPNAAKMVGATSLRKYNADEPRVPAGNSDGGQWTDLSSPSSPAVSPPTIESSADDKDQEQAFAGELIDQRSNGVETICTYMTPTGTQYSFIVPMGNYTCPKYHPAPL